MATQLLDAVRWLEGTPLLPDICVGCLARPPTGSDQFCERCAARLRPLPAPRCSACGGSVDGLLAVCAECLAAPERPWNHAAGVYEYGGFVRELVHRFKYGGATFLAPPLAGRMAEAWRRFGDGQPDLITSVPMHGWRRFTRGYNQAELLAAELARILRAPCANLAKRTRWVGKQVALGRDERKRNLSDVFAIRPRSVIEDRHVLVIDDVFTTGSTLEALTIVLKARNPSKISVLTLARG